jgi:hypothetical protein
MFQQLKVGVTGLYQWHVIYHLRGRIQKFTDWVVTKYTLTTINTRWEATQRVMAAKLTRLTHIIAIQLYLVAESCTICSSRSRRPVRKLLDTPSYNDVKFVYALKIILCRLWISSSGPMILPSFIKRRGGGDFLTSWVTVSFSRRTLLHGVSTVVELFVTWHHTVLCLL